MFEDGAGPAAKKPAAITSPFGSSSSAATYSPVALPTPVPTEDHAAPVHRATAGAYRLPAVMKAPPASTSPFASASNADTRWSVPLELPAPSGAHVAPFQLAMRLA